VNRFIEITVIWLVCILFLFIVKSSFGLAGPVGNLQNESGADSGQRAELLNYFTAHNITLNPAFNLNNMTLDNLEIIVNGHKANCEAGLHDKIVEFIKMDIGLDDNTRRDVIGLYGHC
jgi:hypothetical protein